MLSVTAGTAGGLAPVGNPARPVSTWVASGAHPQGQPQPTRLSQGKPASHAASAASARTTAPGAAKS